jgi:hypothetical protein
MKRFAPLMQTGKDSTWNCTSPSSLSGDPVWPGEVGGVVCDASEYYYQNEDTIDEFFAMFFNIGVSIPTLQKIQATGLEGKVKALTMLNTRYQFDGDMATSSAAIDPLFWVQHGAVERLFQRIVFEDVMTDMTYTTADGCSGHDAGSPKAWLRGFYFQDPSVVAEDLTNTQLTEILDPNSDGYRDLINFVYDTALFDFCDEFETYLAGGGPPLRGAGGDAPLH